MKILTHKDAQQFLKKAASVASYYGFTPVEDLYDEFKEREGRAAAQTIRLSSPVRGDALSEALTHIASHCKTCTPSGEEPPVPRLFYHVHTLPGRASAGTTLCFSLSAFGMARSTAEAVMLRTARSILEENGVRETVVYVNSMGDSDSAARFLRDAGIHLKKNAGDIPAPAREALKSDTFRALAYLSGKGHPAYDDVPKPMEFLSDKSRRHLSEVIEYLETTGTPYEINERVIGHSASYTDTIFEVRSADDEEEVLCRGGRCDALARSFFGTKDASLVGATLFALFRGSGSPAVPPLRLRKPKIYFIQVGLPARMKSLGIIETLRQANIPLALSFETDGLREQLDKAAALGMPYAVIVGQREVLDDTALVRDLDTQAQDIVPLASLPEHLKALA